MLAFGAGRRPTLVALGRYWPERLLYLSAVPGYVTSTSCWSQTERCRARRAQRLFIATLGCMHPDNGANGSRGDPQSTGHQISFPWDTEPPDKWKIQFHYTRISSIYTERMNQYSLAPDDTSEGGGFQYEDCPRVFSGRNGYGPLRLAWDTNILIDYAKYGHLVGQMVNPIFPSRENTIKRS